MNSYNIFETLKTPLVAYGHQGEIFWANPAFIELSGFPLSAITHKRLSDVIGVTYRIEIGELLSGFFNSGQVVPAFKLIVNASRFDVREIFSEYAFRSKDRFGLYSSAHILEWSPGLFLAFIQPMSEDALVVRYANLGFAMVDDAFRVVEYNEDFYQLCPESGLGRDIKGLRLFDFILSEDWERLIHERKEWEAYLRECREGNRTRWAREFIALAPGNNELAFEFPAGGPWRKDADSLAFDGEGEALHFCLLQRPLEVYQHDLRAEFEFRSERWEGLGFFLFGRRAPGFTTPDEGGFLAVVHYEAIELKENCQTIALAPLPPLDKSLWHRVVLEKCGAFISLSIDGVEILLTFEAGLRPGAGQDSLGFFARHPVQFKNLSLSARPSLAEPGKPGSRVHDIRFKKQPGSIYRMKFHKRRYGRHLLTGALFFNVTDLKEKERALEKSEREREILSRENITLRTALSSDLKGVESRSPSMENIQKTIREVAPTNATVLIQGETGTGKELLAQTLHRLSLRAQGPFIKVDCAALPESILESELFGHEKGAFTGAMERRIGRFELAHGGTLFLDEVGNIPLPVQAKLLRILQDRNFERLGGVQTVRSDFRLLCAANEDLEKLVAAGRFRQDLFYRINVVSIKLPSLRDRKDDLAVLTLKFMDEFSDQHGKAVTQVTSDALDLLGGHAWPGNIRELRNAVEKAVVLGRGATLDAGDFKFLEIRSRRPAASSVPGGPARPSRRALLFRLRKHRGNVLKAARDLGVSPGPLYYLIKTLHIDAKRLRSAGPERSDLEARILHHLETSGPQAFSRLRSALSVPAAVLRRSLVSLKMEGCLRSAGRGEGAVYQMEGGKP